MDPPGGYLFCQLFTLRLMTSDEGKFEIVLFGATGFVGQLTARYLAEHYPSLRVALAGRSETKLQALVKRLPTSASQWSILVADSGNPDSLARLAESARLVISTVGPYSNRGLALVEACARAGTDYVDLTGEVLFVRDCVDRFDQLARENNARIVNSCGFDSIPSDLGVLALADAAAKLDQSRLTTTTLIVYSMKGGFSGGTLASMRQQMEEIGEDRSRRRVIGDPYALSPDRASEPQPGDGYDQPGVRFLPDLKLWTAPFVMSTFNTRIVRRSNALSNYSYGRDFRYQEFSAAKNKNQARKVALGLGLFVTAMQKPLLRKLISRFLPKPGTGPSEEAMRNGRFRISIFTKTDSGRSLRCKVGLDLDPGYMGTALMLVESAVCLLETPKDRVGVLTTATAMGMPLVERLRKAGMVFDVSEVDEIKRS